MHIMRSLAYFTNSPFSTGPTLKYHPVYRQLWQLIHVTLKIIFVHEEFIQCSIEFSVCVEFIPCDIEDHLCVRQIFCHLTFQNHNTGGSSQKFSSCSTILIDDSTVSQPNLKNTIRAVALAIYFHIKNRDHREILPNDDRALDVFDEKLNPVSVGVTFFCD